MLQTGFMDEVRRLAYLRAMGVDAYISRGQVSGAAVTQRLAIVRKLPAPPPSLEMEPAAGIPEPPQPHSSIPVQLPRIDTARVVPLPAAAPPARAARAELPGKFRLAAISCGGWLWLEELADPAFTAEQLQLLQAMAEALRPLENRDKPGGRDPVRPEVAQFDWPIHTNQQLDLGPEAARSSVAGFIQRKLDQLACRGLVLLGADCEARVALEQLQCERLARTVSTAAMLRNPLLKKQAWADLRPVFQRA